MSTGQGVPTPPNPQHTTVSDNRGNETTRIDGKLVDTAALQNPITFPFSGRTAMNRFLKAPMTERLCHWNKEGEETVHTLATS